jgi:hypothetical protein
MLRSRHVCESLPNANARATRRLMLCRASMTVLPVLAVEGLPEWNCMRSDISWRSAKR